MPPARPTDLAAKVEGDRILADWKGEAGAYRLELARDNRFIQPVLKQNIGEVKAAIPKPEAGEYWLRVVAIGADGVESPASAPLALTVKQDVPWWLLLFLVLLL